MTKKFLKLKIKNTKNPYPEIAHALEPYKNKEKRSIEFIVEGPKEDPSISLRYPGRKVFKRNLKKPHKNSALWANLYDFEVVAYSDGEKISSNELTFEKLLTDFNLNKINNEKFWKLIEKIYLNEKIEGDIPQLPGINPKIFLLVLKWMWIQEDFNYKYNWKEVKSTTKYVLENKTGSPTRKGSGRAKFFAALILVRKEYFSLEEVKKIINLY